MNGVFQQFGDFSHVPAVFGFPVELAAQVPIRLRFASGKMPHNVQRVFRVQMVRDNLPIHADVYNIKGMETVLRLDVDLIVDVFQDENHAGLFPFDNRVNPKRRMIDLLMILHVG